VEAYLGLGAVLGQLGDDAAQAAAYQTALQLRPDDAITWSKLGVALSAVDGEETAAEAAFRRCVSSGADDARGPLNLGRYLAKLSRPAEAIHSLYAASAIDAEYFEEVILGVGTARGQQGRLREAIASFEAALRLTPTNDKLRASLGPMAANAAAVEAVAATGNDAVTDLCGTPCQDVVDSAGYSVCAITWADGCGEVPPPAGFTAQTLVAQLCHRACSFYVWARTQQRK